MNNYAVVPGPGLHGNRCPVIAVYPSFAEAHKRADRMTKGLRRSMRRHGGTSGYYRVIDGEYLEVGRSAPGHAIDCTPEAVALAYEGE